MEFTPATQNGINAPTEYFILPSRFALAVSATTFATVEPITLKAYSDAQVYKRNPVTFYRTQGTSTHVIGVGTWISTTTCALINTHISTTGTHQIYASWPGELKYAPKSTELNPITITANPSAAFSGSLILTSSVNPVNSNASTILTLRDNGNRNLTGPVTFRATTHVTTSSITTADVNIINFQFTGPGGGIITGGEFQFSSYFTNIVVGSTFTIKLKTSYSGHSPPGDQQVPNGVFTITGLDNGNVLTSSGLQNLSGPITGPYNIITFYETLNNVNLATALSYFDYTTIESGTNYFTTYTTSTIGTSNFNNGASTSISFTPSSVFTVTTNTSAVIQATWEGGFINGSPTYGSTSNTLTQTIIKI